METLPQRSMASIKTHISSTLLIVLVVFALSWQGVAVASPEKTVDAVTEDVLKVLRERRAELEADPSLVNGLIDQVIAPYIDFQTMSRMVLGRYWRTATDEQRSRFTAEFKGFLVRFYAAAVREYIVEEGIPDDISVEVQDLREPPRSRTAKVKSQILQPGRPPVSLSYTLYKRSEEWRVVDLQVESISLVINYRQSFASKIRTAGLDALIETLAARNGQA